MPLEPKQEPPYYTTEGGDTPTGLKTYKALITQSDENAPVAIVLQNTFENNIIWTRTGIGTYIGTLTGAFTTNKTYTIVSNNASLIAAILINRASANTIEITTGLVDNTPLDSSLNNTSIEITVYP